MGGEARRPRLTYVPTVSLKYSGECHLSQKITKEIYFTFLKDSFEKAASNPEKFKELSFQVLHFLTENYLNMTTEMQEMADKMIDASIEIVDSSFKKAPDTEEYRAARRRLRILKWNLPY